MSPILSRAGFSFGFGRRRGNDSNANVDVNWSQFTQTATFSYTGSDQTWTVPAGTTKIGVFIWGAAGGSYIGGARTPNSYDCAGSGGYTEAIIEAVPNETLYVVVGQGGGGGNFTPATYGGGGQGGGTPRGAGEWGSAGGGLSGVFAGGPIFSGASVQSGAFPKSLAIAGGGGGSSLIKMSENNPPSTGPRTWGKYDNVETFSYHNAGGGGLSGENGTVDNYYKSIPLPYVVGTNATGGGTQSAGGSNIPGGVSPGQSGSQLRGGNCPNSPYEYAGGGGGGGYYGGGGGTSGWPSPAYGGGGGGSGFIGNTSLTLSNINNTFSGTSSVNMRKYWIAFTTIATRLTSGSNVISNGGVPVFTSPISSSYYPGSAGKAPAAGSGALIGNPGYVVIRY